MKSSRCARRLAALVLAVGGASVSASASVAADATPPSARPKPATTPAALSNTTWAQYTLRTGRIRSSGQQPQLQVVLARLRDPKVGGAIGQELTGVPAERVVHAIGEIEWRSDDAGADVMFRIDLDPKKFPGARPAAKEFADRLVARFGELLVEEARQQDGPRLAEAREWLQTVQDDLARVRGRMAELQAEMGGRSPDALRVALAKLDDEAQRVELDLAGMQARQVAVEEAIARTLKQAEEQSKADPVIAELEKAVAAQEKLVEVMRRQYESGVTSQTAVVEAEAKLTDVRVTLLDRKRGLSGGGGAGDAAAALNRELQTLGIEVVDRKARLRFVKERTEALTKAARLAADYEQLDAERAALFKELGDAREQLRRVKRLVEWPEPTHPVTVVKADQGRHEQPTGQ